MLFLSSFGQKDFLMTHVNNIIAVTHRQPVAPCEPLGFVVRNLYLDSC